MTSPEIETAAAAAYATYQTCRARSRCRITTWSALPGKEQRRWCLAAAAVLNHPTLAPADVRLRYLDGDESWPWENVTPKFATCWVAVTAELRRIAATAEVAA